MRAVIFLVFGAILGATVLVAKLFYSANFAALPYVFAPLNVSLSAKTCDGYAIVADAGSLRHFWSKERANIGFHRYGAAERGESSGARRESSGAVAVAEGRNLTTAERLESRVAGQRVAGGGGREERVMCNMNREMIERGVSRLVLRAPSRGALEDIDFINVTIGSRNFYLSGEEIRAKFLGADAGGGAADSTAGISHENGAAKTAAAADSQRDSEDSPKIFTLDLSGFKISADSRFMNAQESLFVGAILWLFSPPFLVFWALVGILALFVALKPAAPTPPPKMLNKLRDPKIQTRFALFFIALIAIFARLVGFDGASLWGDEIYSVSVVGYPSDGWGSIFGDPGNPPFYFLLLKIWLKIFGFGFESARLLSVFLGVLAVFSVYVLLKNHAKSTSAALFGAFLMALSQVAIGASHEVRGYVLVLVLCPLAANFLLNYWHGFRAGFGAGFAAQKSPTKSPQKPRTRDLALYILCGILLVNMHYYGAIFIFASFVAVAILAWCGAEKNAGLGVVVGAWQNEEKNAGQKSQQSQDSHPNRGANPPPRLGANLGARTAANLAQNLGSSWCESLPRMP